MSIKINFTATTSQQENLLRTVKKTAEEKDYEVRAWKDGLEVALCPIGDMTIWWKTDKKFPGQWLIIGECCTSPAGAGLHKAAIDLIDCLNSLVLENLEVDDITGYYGHRDFERLKNEHFYPWLNSLIHICRESFESDKYSNVSICWNMDQYQPQNIPGTLTTPLGRFTMDSLNKCADNQDINWFAHRFFLWDNQEKDALYYRNTAMNLLWEHCWFAPSDRSHEDKAINQQILSSIEKANRMDLSLPLPILAYNEVCRLDCHEPNLLPGTKDLVTDFPIGFRKTPVTYSYGNLRFTLPGIYRYEWEEYGESENGEGCDSWWDSSSDSPVWRITEYRRQKGNAGLTEHIYRENDLECMDMDYGKACWGWKMEEEDGKQFYIITCEAVAGPSLYVITISYTDEKDRQSIYGLLKKLNVVKE